MSQCHSDQAASPEFAIQRLYVKDVSFEAPQVPAIFQEQWQNDFNAKMQLNINHAVLHEDIYEVVLQVTVTVTAHAKILFLVEVQQAGIFTLQGFTTEQLPQLFNITCPTILFPYAREVVSDLVVRATFPPLHLAPVNFETMYQTNTNHTLSTANNSIVIMH